MLIITANEEANSYLWCLPIPQMLSTTQDGFTASTNSQHSAGTQPSGRGAFFVSTQGGTNHCRHSMQIGAGNRAYSQIQLPKKSIAKHLEIGARKNETSGNLRPIRAFTLQGSNDGTNFTTIKSVDNLGNSWSIGSIQRRDLDNSTSYLYYRLNVQANSSYVAFDYRQITS